MVSDGRDDARPDQAEDHAPREYRNAAIAAIVGPALGAGVVLGSPADPEPRAAPAAKAAKPKQIKLACALKSNGTLRYITRASQCRARMGALLRLDPGPADVCVRKRSTIKPRGVAAARRITNQVAVCGRSRSSNETPLKLPTARDEFFCVEKRSKAMRWSNRRPRCRARGRFAEVPRVRPEGRAVAAGGSTGRPGEPAGRLGWLGRRRWHRRRGHRRRGDTPNRAPVAKADSATTDEDSARAVDVLANDSDPDGTAVSVASVALVGNSGQRDAEP